MHKYKNYFFVTRIIICLQNVINIKEHAYNDYHNNLAAENVLISVAVSIPTLYSCRHHESQLKVIYPCTSPTMRTKKNIYKHVS